MDTEPDDVSDNARELHARLVKLYDGIMDGLYRDAAERRGEPPTSITELWDHTDRPSYHNPYPADGLPVALDFTPGWCAPPERWDLIADAEAAVSNYAKAHPSDGMWDVAPTATPPPPGGWGWVRQADTAEGIPVYAFPDPPDGKMYYHGADGGWWLVDDHGANIEAMRPIVADAMRRIGMDPRGTSGD